MWPLRRKKEQYVAITLHSDALTFGLFTRGNTQFPYYLQTYRTKHFEAREVIAQTIFNNTTLIKTIKEMIQSCNANHAYTMFGIDSSLVHEKFVMLPTATPTEESLSNIIGNCSLAWDHRLLYKDENNEFTHYACGLPRDQLFQYKLLAHSCVLNLIGITSTTMAHLAAWHMRNDDNELFANQMQRHKNNVQKLLDINDLIETTELNTEISFEKPADIYRVLALLGLAKTGMNL